MAKRSLEDKIAEAEDRLNKRKKLYEDAQKEVEELKEKKLKEDQAELLKEADGETMPVGDMVAILRRAKKTTKTVNEILDFMGEDDTVSVSENTEAASEANEENNTEE